MWTLGVVIQPACRMRYEIWRGIFEFGTLILCVCESKLVAEVRICTWKPNKDATLKMAHKQTKIKGDKSEGIRAAAIKP
jgi:hypothetical protein